MDKILEEDYRKALNVCTEYHLQNDGFYAKMDCFWGADEKGNPNRTTTYYDNFEAFVEGVIDVTRKDMAAIEGCERVTKQEYEQNSLPF